MAKYNVVLEKSVRLALVVIFQNSHIGNDIFIFRIVCAFYLYSVLFKKRIKLFGKLFLIKRSKV